MSLKDTTDCALGTFRTFSYTLPNYNLSLFCFWSAPLYADTQQLALYPNIETLISHNIETTDRWRTLIISLQCRIGYCWETESGYLCWCYWGYAAYIPESHHSTASEVLIIPYSVGRKIQNKGFRKVKLLSEKTLINSNEQTVKHLSDTFLLGHPSMHSRV